MLNILTFNIVSCTSVPTFVSCIIYNLFKTQIIMLCSEKNVTFKGTSKMSVDIFYIFYICL